MEILKYRCTEVRRHVDSETQKDSAGVYPAGQFVASFDREHDEHNDKLSIVVLESDRAVFEPGALYEMSLTKVS